MTHPDSHHRSGHRSGHRSRRRRSRRSASHGEYSHSGHGFSSGRLIPSSRDREREADLSTRRWTLLLLLIGFSYVCPYVLLSLGGRYEPVRNANGTRIWQPMQATWDPQGTPYGNSKRRKNGLGTLFAPLIEIDRAVFHPDQTF